MQNNDMLRQLWPEELAVRYRTKGYWRGETFDRMLRDRATAHGGQLAVVGGETSWTYADLLERAEAAAGGFLSLGLQPGDRVIVQLPIIAAFFPAVFGLFLAGLLPVFALPAHRQAELIHLARKARAKALVQADRHERFDYRPLALAVQGEAPDLRHLMVAGAPAPGMLAFDDLRPGPALRRPIPIRNRWPSCRSPAAPPGCRS